MLITVLTVIGVAFILIGLAGLVMLAVQPIKTAWMIVFKRKDDYLFYETSEKGKALLESQTRAVRDVCIVFIIMGTLSVGAALFLMYVPRGTGSDEGAHADGIDSSGTYWSEDVGYECYIRVTGTTIELNRKKLKGIDELQGILDGTDRSQTILLVDAYASSNTFHAIQEELDERNLKWKEKNE